MSAVFISLAHEIFQALLVLSVGEGETCEDNRKQELFWGGPSHHFCPFTPSLPGKKMNATSGLFVPFVGTNLC